MCTGLTPVVASNMAMYAPVSGKPHQEKDTPCQGDSQPSAHPCGGESRRLQFFHRKFPYHNREQHIRVQLRTYGTHSFPSFHASLQYQPTMFHHSFCGQPREQIMWTAIHLLQWLESPFRPISQDTVPRTGCYCLRGKSDEHPVDHSGSETQWRRD